MWITANMRKGDYDVTTVVHSDTYPEIDPTKVNLSGKAVFITGGSRGIGRAMVLSFAKAGASHIAVGARSGMSQLAKDIEAAASSAGREPPTFLPIKLDVANGDSVQQAANEVDKVFGKLDVLVNNAGILGNPKLITESSPDEWWQVFDINLRGPYLIARAFLPLLLKGETKYVVNVASVGALIAGPTLSAYQTAKMALVKFSQFIDVEYASQGIVSFCIHPGNCLTDIVGGFDIAEDLKPGMAIFIFTLWKGMGKGLTRYSFLRFARGKCRLGRLFGFGKTRLAGGTIYQLYVGYA